MGITPGPSGELGGASASSHTPFHGDMVKIRVAIEEQLRRISQSQVQNGTVVGLAFATTRELVVRHGRAYIIRPLPRGRWSHEPQACYANALHAAIARKWVYVEGFAIPKSGGLAVLHAWVSNPQNSGVAYDPTWRAGREYFGIPFRLDYVLRMCEKSGHVGVLDVWELGWPLLRGEDRIEDVMWKPGRARSSSRRLSDPF